MSQTTVRRKVITQLKKVKYQTYKSNPCHIAVPKTELSFISNDQVNLFIYTVTFTNSVIFKNNRCGSDYINDVMFECCNVICSYIGLNF